ncbi:MAG: hypothetical protein E3J90_02910 [Promethearchaeota archaeon]|nr:MAG: hypothetical protein E3J90_02910 [Candidatus Lokiarchaeota archaeon]
MESASLKQFDVTCPKCGNGKIISVPGSLFIQKKFGTVKIKVPQGAVCKDHNFIVFISTKGQIIGYDIIDASVSLDQKEKLPENLSDLALDQVIDVFGFNCVAGFLHAKLFDYPSYVIRYEEFALDIEQLNDMFDKLIPPNYRNSNAIKDDEFDSYVFPNPNYYYTTFKREHTDAFLINNRKLVIQVPWRIQIDFEKSILNNAVGKKDKSEQLQYLAQYIKQFISDVEFTQNLLENVKNISKKDLIKKLKEKLIVSTINKNRILSIKEFITRRISKEVGSKIKK